MGESPAKRLEDRFLRGEPRGVALPGPGPGIAVFHLSLQEYVTGKPLLLIEPAPEDIHVDDVYPDTGYPQGTALREGIGMTFLHGFYPNMKPLVCPPFLPVPEGIDGVPGDCDKLR